MLKFIQRSCLTLLAGTTLSISMNIQEAKADMLDDIFNQCMDAYNFGQLDEQGFAYCNRVAQLKEERDTQINTRNFNYQLYLQQLQSIQNVLNMGANPVEIKPTNFGF